MGLLNCGTRQYFYESKRVNGKVVNRLVAKGLAADYYALASRLERDDKADRAAEARERRSIRREQRARLKEQVRLMGVEERPLIDLAELMGDLVEAAMVDAGYRKRRSEWRRPRGETMDETESRRAEIEGEIREVTLGGYLGVSNFDDFLGTAAMVDIKSEGGRVTAELVEHKPDDLENRKRRLILHFKKAADFDQSEVPAIRRAFAEYEKTVAKPMPDGSPAARPFLASMIEVHGGDAVKRAESALIRRFATGRGLYCEESLRRHLAKFKEDLLGDNPTPIERVLVDSIGCSYLDAMESEERSARTTSGKPALMDYLEKRKERATRRLHRGLKSLDLVRRKLVSGVAVQVINHISQAPSSVDGSGRSNEAHDASPSPQMIASGDPKSLGIPEFSTE